MRHNLQDGFVDTAIFRVMFDLLDEKKNRQVLVIWIHERWLKKLFIVWY